MTHVIDKNGQIKTVITGDVSQLNDLSDVVLGAEAKGELLIYNATTSKWVNASITAGTNLTATEGDGSLQLDVDDAFLSNTGDVGTGAYDFGGATDFEIPNSATPTVDTAGQIAIDTTITDHTGLITYHDGTEALYAVGIPTGNLGTTDGSSITYNATNNEFEMVVKLSNVVEDTTPQLGGNLDLNSNDITGTGNINITGSIDVDNINIDGNTISSTDVNGNIILVPNGNGNVDIYDPGLETTGININGTTYSNAFRVNDFGGSNDGMLHLHRHSTTLPTSILGSRANSNTTAHAAVTAGQNLLRISATGHTGTHYDFFGDIIFKASSSGTISGTSSPGAIEFKTVPDGSNSSATVLTLDEDKSATFTGNIDLAASTNLSVNGTNILADSAGTMTLSNVDALDATTIATVESTFLRNDGDTGTGVYDFGGATSFEIPNGTGPTTNAAGEIAMDTNGDGLTVTTGVIQGYDGTQNLYFFGATNYPSTDNDVMVYDSATNSVKWEAQSGSGGGISNVVEDTTPQLGGDLDANGFDIQFDDATGIRDDSDNEQLIFQKTASAVNYLEITNAATGNDVTIAANGSDVNVGIDFVNKGAGTFSFDADIDVTGDVGGTTIGGITEANLVDKSAAEAITGAWDFGSATSLEIPNSATPTVNASGEIAVDTTITDHTGLITYHDGTEALYVIALPTGNLSASDGHVISYNATNNEFEMSAQTGGLANIVEDTTPQLGGGLDLNSNDITGTGNINITGTITSTGDLTIYEAVNDGNPEIRLGSADAEELHIQTVYDSLAQTLDYVLLQTDAASATANKGLFRFNVDGTDIMDVDDGGIDLDSGKAISIAGTDVLDATTLGSGVVSSSLTSVGALDSGSITANFGAIDNGVSNITTGGIVKIDVDGTAINAAGSLTMGAGNDAGIFFNGTDLVIQTDGAGASGIILDSEDDTLEIKGSGVLQATFDTGGLNIVSGDEYSIAGTSVLNATTLGSGVTASSLTSTGALNSGSITSGFGAIDNGTSNITTGGILKVDVDGTGINAAGSITYGAGDDVGIYWDGDENYIHQTTALTNAITYNTFKHETSGVPANGIGVGIQFEQETAAGNYEKIAAISAEVTDTTATAEDAELNINLMIAGAAHTTTATFDLNGLNLASGDGYSIAGSSVLNATTLGSGVTASSLTSVGTITSGTWQGTTIAVDQGGTGQTSYTNGQLLIGNTTGNTLTKATLTGGTNLTVTNGTGSITLDVDDSFILNTGDVGTGVYDFGGATSFEIPNGAAPTVNAAGEVAVDTTITDHTGLITYHDGTEALYVIALPTANLGTTDGDVIAYNATNNEFEMVANAGGGGGATEQFVAQRLMAGL